MSVHVHVHLFERKEEGLGAMPKIRFLLVHLSSLNVHMYVDKRMTTDVVLLRCFLHS